MAKDNFTTSQLFTDANELRTVLNREGKKLERIARRIWQQYIGSYRPAEYMRTGNSARSIKLGIVKNLGVDAQGFTTFGIELTWENHLVYHDSWLYNNPLSKHDWSINSNIKGHSVMLIGTKWDAPKLEKIFGRAVERFTTSRWTKIGGTQEATYIKAVMAQYESEKDPRINLELQWSGRFYY